MELHKAIRTAGRFCASTGKLDRIRFFKNAVYGTDGECGVLIETDVATPDTMALPVKDLLPINRPVKKVKIEGADKNMTVNFYLSDGEKHVLRHTPAVGHPMYPDIPKEFKEVGDPWKDVLKVTHAAASDGRDDLKCVHFSKDRIEATDSHRIALADVALGFEGNVPGKVFKYWPKGFVSMMFTKTHAWFSTGDEVRFAKLQDGNFASGSDLRDRIPEFSEGTWMSLWSKEFKDQVKSAMKSDERGFIKFNFGINQLTISNPSKAYLNEIKGQLGLNGKVIETPEIVVSGKYVVDALKLISTPKVRVCYGDPAFLRLESAAYVEAICRVRL